MALSYLKGKTTNPEDVKLVQEIFDATNEEGEKWMDMDEEEIKSFEYFVISTFINEIYQKTTIQDSLRTLKDYLYNNKFYEIRDLILNSSKLKDARNHYQKEIDTLVYKPEREAGVYTCRKCKSNNIDTYEVQMRSGDEPMTIFANCTECGFKWKE